MKKLLNRQDVDRQVSEIWEKVGQISDEDNGRQDAVDEALLVQQNLYKQLDLQDKALPLLWEAVHIINPENPLTAALSLSANAERLKPVLKSYLTATT